ncbi:MAG TPA: hypothetical protein VFH25_05515 [Nitrososphaeraceae archaeon]|nr:hypothetical protein [Nitrososphaeraceae archaeon]
MGTYQLRIATFKDLQELVQSQSGLGGFHPFWLSLPADLISLETFGES